MAYKAVFQLSSGSGEDLVKALRQISNTYDALEKVAVELVLHGKAAGLLESTDNEYAGMLEKWHERGVKVKACANALRALELEKEDLLELIEIIPSAVAYIIVKQTEGWAYIKVD